MSSWRLFLFFLENPIATTFPGKLNTGLAWQQLDFDAVVSIVGTYAHIDPAWPHAAWKSKNLLQLDFQLIVNTNPGGAVFLKIAAPYVPIERTYLLPSGGVLLDWTGDCTAWIVPGGYFVHVVYAIEC